jgi:hypothetical protein
MYKKQHCNLKNQYMLKTRQTHIVLPAAQNNAAFREKFDECLFQIPDGPGNCVIIAYKGNESKVIDVVKSSPRLRKEVRCGTKNGPILLSPATYGFAKRCTKKDTIN